VQRRPIHNERELLAAYGARDLVDIALGLNATERFARLDHLFFEPHVEEDDPGRHLKGVMIFVDHGPAGFLPYPFTPAQFHAAIEDQVRAVRAYEAVTRGLD
jgi:hypothetical protein